MKRPKVSLEHWQVLQAVIDQGGFAQAAAFLHRSQSSVSYAVAKLQDQLGVPVLAIEGRRARLTKAGEALLRRSRRLVRDAVALERFADSLGRGWEPEVRLVVDAAFPAEVLMDALSRFQPLSRGSRVQLREVVLSGAEEALENGSADLVIGGSVPSRWVGDPLMDVGFVAVAGTGHPLCSLGRSLSLGDLAGELQVVVRDSGTHRPREMGWLGAEHRWSVGSIDSAVTAVSRGLGIAWLPVHRIQGLLDAGVLVRLPLADGGSFRATLYLVFGDPEQAGPAARLLADLLRQSARARVEG